MNGIPITIWTRVDDGMGDTHREQVDAYVLDTGEIVFSDGRIVPDSELSRDSNRREVERGRLEAKLAVVSEKILVIDSGTSVGALSSSIVKAYSRLRLIEKKEAIEHQLMEA